MTDWYAESPFILSGFAINALSAERLNRSYSGIVSWEAVKIVQEDSWLRHGDRNKEP